MLIKLCGKPYTLRYDFNAMCDMEDILGKSVMEVFKSEDQIGFKVFRSIIWAGLNRTHPMTVEEAGELVGNEIIGKPNRLQELYGQIETCMRQDGVFDEEPAPETPQKAGFNNQEKKAQPKKK